MDAPNEKNRGPGERVEDQGAPSVVDRRHAARATEAAMDESVAELNARNQAEDAKEALIDSEPATDPLESGDAVDMPPEYTHAMERAYQRLVTARTNPHPPSEDDLAKIDVLTQTAVEFATAIEFLCPETRDQSLALTAVEDALTRASKSIYLKDPIGGVRRPSLKDLAADRIRQEQDVAGGRPD